MTFTFSTHCYRAHHKSGASPGETNTDPFACFIPLPSKSRRISVNTGQHIGIMQWNNRTTVLFQTFHSFQETLKTSSSKSHILRNIFLPILTLI